MKLIKIFVNPYFVQCAESEAAFVLELNPDVQYHFDQYEYEILDARHITTGEKLTACPPFFYTNKQL